jgi:hypothetical protein
MTWRSLWPTLRRAKSLSHLLIRQRTQLINAPCAHLAELGVVVATSIERTKSMLKHFL